MRHGPLHQISLVGTVTEEVGGYFPDMLQRLEDNTFLKMVILPSFYVLLYIYIYIFLCSFT